MKSLRGGLIGCGFFASNHLNAWRDLDGAAIVAVCDRDPAKANDAASAFGIPAVYGDAPALLASEEPDFVDLFTTLARHRPLCALPAARHVAATCPTPLPKTH